MELEGSRLKLLAQLPLVLNSSLELSRVMQVAIREFASSLNAEAVTLYVLDDAGENLTFWYSEGEQGSALKDRKMPADRGIVGWVIKHQESVSTNEASKDPRFYSVVDKNTGFETKSALCVPLTSRGERRIGAIQALNCRAEVGFGGTDLVFAEQFSHHVALAMENATLVEQLKVERARLETLERRKSEMMTVITHEIRTPLSLISASSSAILGGGLPQESVSKMQTILQKGLDRLTKLVSELRNLSLLSRGEITLDPQSIALDSIIKDEVDGLTSAFEQRKLSLSLSLDPNAAIVRADEALIRIVIRNIVSNAIRFTPDGGAVSVELAKDLGLAKVAIRDTGIGISPEELPLIFEKFYEVGAAIHHSSGDYAFKSGGLGIGLSTVKSILSSHGSELHVISELGKGSEFSFSLPLRG